MAIIVDEHFASERLTRDAKTAWTKRPQADIDPYDALKTDIDRGQLSSPTAKARLGTGACHARTCTGEARGPEHDKAASYLHRRYVPASLRTIDTKFAGAAFPPRVPFS